MLSAGSDRAAFDLLQEIEVSVVAKYLLISSAYGLAADASSIAHAFDIALWKGFGQPAVSGVAADLAHCPRATSSATARRAGGGAAACSDRRVGGRITTSAARGYRSSCQQSDASRRRCRVAVPRSCRGDGTEAGNGGEAREGLPASRVASSVDDRDLAGLSPCRRKREWLTFGEALDFAGVSHYTLQRWREARLLPDTVRNLYHSDVERVLAPPSYNSRGHRHAAVRAVILAR